MAVKKVWIKVAYLAAYLVALTVAKSVSSMVVSLTCHSVARTAVLMVEDLVVIPTELLVVC